MNCIKCNISVNKKPLFRTGPMGGKPEWMCKKCIKETEPELAKNIEQDQSDLEKDLEDIFYK